MPPRASSSGRPAPPPPAASAADSAPRQPRKPRPTKVPADSLLTFNTYTPPRPSRDTDIARQRRPAAPPLPPRSPDAFVQANYRFAVSADALSDIAACTALHDAPVPWHAVQLVFVTGSHSCPISLQTLRCPRITPCGHVFEFTCILQHLFYNDPEGDLTRDVAAKCPVCSSRIVQSDLKPCVFRSRDVLEVGVPFRMRLVARDRASMIATLYHDPNCDSVPHDVTAESPLYSRLGIASDAYLTQLGDDTIRELRGVGQNDPNINFFVDCAVREVEAKVIPIRSRLKAKRMACLRERHERKPARRRAERKAEVEADRKALLQIKQRFEEKDKQKFAPRLDRHAAPHAQSKPEPIAQPRAEGEGKLPNVTPPYTESNLEPARNAESNANPDETGRNIIRNAKVTRVFYQASDTQNVFLHPVNHRCLSTEFAADFSQALTDIAGPVLEIERHTMDAMLRKKYRFLDHLPDGCEFAFAELDLSALLSASTLESHAAELHGRKVSRKRRESLDKRESRRIEKKKTESLKSYFDTRGGCLPGGPRNPERIDSRDVNSFPALSGARATQDACRTTGAAATDEEGVREAEQASSASTSETRDASGASDISSYSSVTSKMGLFPPLETSPVGSVPRQPAFPSIGEVSSEASAPHTNQPSVWFPRSPDTQAREAPQESVPEPLAGCRAQSAVERDALPTASPRKSRRSQRKTTILSNAGVPYRR